MNKKVSKKKYQQVYDLACKRKGGEEVLLQLLSKPLSEKKLKKIGDDRFLAEFTKKIFQSGFVWKVVEKKWPNFEKAFFQFGISDVLMMPDELIEERAKDPSIIRNYRKVKTVKENAQMIHDVRYEGGTFAEFIANWPCEDMVGLWDYLKKNGSRLGGNTGPYALRTLGKDTFLISRDVELYLLNEDVFHGSSSSKRSRNEIQAFFNELQQQSGRPLQQLSQIIGFSSGDNFVLPE